MSATDLDERTTPPPPRRRADLRVSASGVRTVALLELRQRLRATRWLVVLLVWVGVLVGVSALARLGWQVGTGRSGLRRGRGRRPGHGVGHWWGPFS